MIWKHFVNTGPRHSGGCNLYLLYKNVTVCVLLEGRKNKSNNDNQYCELLFDKNQEKIN